MPRTKLGARHAVRRSHTRRKRTIQRRRPERARADVQLADTGADSPTALAAEAARTGVLPRQVRSSEPEIPGSEGETMRIGDPDVSPLANEYSGEEAPGGSTPTPDQNSVDDVGRAYGVQEEDTGALRPASEILERRDRRRN